MKKLIALLLAMVMVIGLFAACEKKDEKQEETESVAETTEAPEVHVPAVEIYTNIWNKFTEDEVFPVNGGAPETYGEMIEVDENYMMPQVPAEFDMKYNESLTTYLCIPADQLSNLEEVAYAQHGMMINNFACGVLHVKEDVKGFAETMKEALQNNQWMCGQPEQLLIAVIDSNHVLVGYGLEVAMTPVATHLVEAYPDAEIIIHEALAA